MKFKGTWDQFPSDESIDLAKRDPVAHKLLSKALRREERNRQQKIISVLNRRTQSAQSLARRKSERETVENYTQTPYRAENGLLHGVDVMTTRFDEIDGRMEVAKKVRADQVLGKFANFMREHMLRVRDLIDKVDTSCDGVVDLEELAAAVKLVGIDMTDDEIQVLFHFLDDSNDGTIDAEELETAMRDYRRINFERDSLMSYIERTAVTMHEPILSSDKVVDGRLLSVGVKGKARQINSIPQLGQSLIHKRYEADLSDGSHLSMALAPKLLYTDSFTSSLTAASMTAHEPIEIPPSGVKMQADVAIHKGNIVDRGLEQEYAKGLKERRLRQREIVFRRKAARELLESKAGQRPENAMQKAQAFYEGCHGTIEVTIKEARNVEMADLNGSDPMCKLYFSNNDVFETSVQWNTLNPVWNETFRFRIADPEELNMNVKIEMYDQDPHQQEFLGETYIRCEALEPMRRLDMAVELQKASTGCLFMSALFTPVSVLIEAKAKEFADEKVKLAQKLSPRLEEALKAKAARARRSVKTKSKSSATLKRASSMGSDL